MGDRGLVDLIIARMAPLKPAEKVLLCRRCKDERDLSALSKGDLEGLFGRVLAESGWNPEGFRAQAEQDQALARMRGIGYVSCMSPLYPPLLREIWDPPAVLFYRGRLPDPEKPLIALVGTRAPSPGALLQSYDIAKALGREGIPVVSGLAQGIDAMAHRGNLDGGGSTVAVLGSGLDEIYPAINRALARRMVEQGGVLLSEYPPGMKPRKWHFPARNRIISALARGTLIVEAPAASGALITARFALEQGRDLWVASTGAAADPQDYRRRGTQKLAEEGAPVITSAEEILREWGMVPKTGGAEKGAFNPSEFAASLARSLQIGCEE